MSHQGWEENDRYILFLHKRKFIPSKEKKMDKRVWALSRNPCKDSQKLLVVEYSKKNKNNIYFLESIYLYKI